MKYFLFDKAQKYVTRINTEYIIEAHYTEEINTAGQLEFTLPAAMRLPKNVFYVCVTDPDDEASYLMFKIITEKVTDEKVTYTCIENAYDELASYTYIQDKRPTAIASAMLQMALDGTRWSVGACPEVSPKFCSFYYISVLEAIQKIVNLWGFEVQFQVKIDGITNEIKQRNVNMYTKLGERTNKRFEYGSNLLSVTQANDSTGLYTALVGRGKGVQVSEGDTDTDPDGYGRRITFADVVWSTQSGNPLNKPAGQEYLEDPNATAAYGFPDGHPRIGFVVFQDCEDPNELIQLTYNKLQEVNHPQVQFSANIADVGSLNLGDTIAIIRHDIGIEYYTRVFKVVHDLLDSSNNTVELGDNIAGSNSITQQISNIQNNQSNVQNAIDTIVMNGSDGNKLFFGTDFPANGTDGDIFYRTLENGGTEMYIYKDGGWQLVVSTEELDAVQKKVDEQTSQIQQAVDSANSAVSKADEAVASIGDAETMAKNAQATANQNKQDIATVQGNIESTKSDLQSTVQELQGVSNDLNTVKQQAISQGQSIIDIQRSTVALGTQMADVQGNVSSLQQTTQSLQSSIQDNTNNISNVKQTATQLSSTISNLQNAGENLIINSTFSQGSYNWNMNGYQISQDVLFMNSKGVSITQTGLTSPKYKNLLMTDKIPVSQGQSISFGCWVKTSGIDASGPGNRGAQIEINWYADKNSQRNNWNNTNDVKTYGDHDWLYLKKENVKVPANSNFVSFNMFLTQNGTAQFVLPLMVFGSTLPSWSPSPLDSATATDMSNVKQTVSSLQSTVQSNTGDISQLQQTASSLQSVVSTKADLSQVTQMGNVIQSVVQNIGPFYPDGDFSDVDLGKYYDPWDTCPNLDNFSVVTNNKDWGYYLQIYTPHGTINKAITKEYLPINAQYSLTFKGKSLLSYDGKLNGSFMVFMHFFDSNKNAIQDQASYYKYDNDNVWQDFSLSFTPPSNAAYVRVETMLDNSKGDGTYWGALDNLSLDNGGSTIASKISQMSDDINLRVQKGDLLSQINIEAGQTLIQSDKLYLDASSVVFSGNAFIPSAAITDLSADKITTGTLNAANVHVINMDVANLVGDTTSFVRSQWQNAYGSYVNIESGGMSVGYGNWFTKFDSLGMTFTDSGDDLGGFTRIGMQGAPSWYGGLAFNAGGDAEFLSIGAKDYHNDNQNPIPSKLLWARHGIDTYGYNPGWNFGDDVWTNKIGINSIQYGSWNIHFGIVVGSNNFSALTLTSGSGNGFYWGSDGSFGYVTGGNALHNVKGSQIVYSIGSDGICHSWGGV